jgi:hypothetical protein
MVNRRRAGRKQNQGVMNAALSISISGNDVPENPAGEGKKGLPRVMMDEGDGLLDGTAARLRSNRPTTMDIVRFERHLALLFRLPSRSNRFCSLALEK